MILLILLLMITHFACCLISHFKTKLAKSYKICRFYHLTIRFKVSNSQGFVVKALFGLLQKLPIKNIFSISWSIQNFSYLWDVSNIELFFLKNVHTSGTGGWSLFGCLVMLHLKQAVKHILMILISVH